MMETTRTCVICGRRFTQEINTGQPKKYCSTECKRIGTNKNQKRIRAERIDQRKANKAMKNVEVGKLDQNLAEARRRGISYAELQKKKTLRMIRRGEL